ncbi:MAG: hypothetical protein GKR89_15110 [Candidatus Latescibacteria bacterium]|nr:hypothetical protein [Candidatus Latescibacterota bacterium]
MKEIKITPTTSIIANEDGTLEGVLPMEGTLGIIFHGGRGFNWDTRTFNAPRAIKLPRVLEDDSSLNFHIAEIAHQEGILASKLNGQVGVVGANESFRINYVTVVDQDQRQTSEQPILGVYLSNTGKYKICLVYKDRVWPDDQAERLQLLDTTPAAIHQAVQGAIADSRSFDNDIELNGVVVVPERNHRAEAQGIHVMSRQTEQTYHSRETGGWWFNLPCMISPWMEVDLQRLLSEYLAKAASGQDYDERFGTWTIDSWCQLLDTLANGLANLHGLDAIHGDQRPANVMATFMGLGELVPSNFSWIDVGLGADLTAQPDEKKDHSPDSNGYTPPPLGGVRTSIFYAPERSEGIEYEDVDVVEIEESEADGKLSIRFFWRRNSLADVEQLQLKNETGAPIHVLGTLQQGDRVQFRDYLFEVDAVAGDHLLCNRAYELALGRVIVHLDAHRVADLFQRKSISRYRIFYHWSQASDIYSFGVLALYVFYVRGLVELLRESNNTSLAVLATDQTQREKAFEGLVLMLRNKTFQKNLYFSLREAGLDDSEALFNGRLEANSAREGRDAASQIVRIVLTSDNQFSVVRRGVNNNNGLFARLMLLCMKCVWRLDELTSEIDKRGNLIPFCPDRNRADTGAQGVASRDLLRYITDLRVMVGASMAVLSAPDTAEETRIAGRPTEPTDLLERHIHTEDELEKKEAELKETKEKLDKLRQRLESFKSELKRNKYGSFLRVDKNSVCRRMNELLAQSVVRSNEGES